MKKFETSETYSTPSICDHNCIFSFKIFKRTEKSVWIKDMNRNIVRKKIDFYNDEETIYPLGHYSMCPVLRASDKEVASC